MQHMNNQVEPWPTWVDNFVDDWNAFPPDTSSNIGFQHYPSELGDSMAGSNRLGLRSDHTNPSMGLEDTNISGGSRMHPHRTRTLGPPPLSNSPSIKHANSQVKNNRKTGTAPQLVGCDLHVESLDLDLRMSTPATVSTAEDGSSKKEPSKIVGSMHTTDDPNTYVFKCGSASCKGKTFGRWYDLKRHHDGAHATQRTVFWCCIPGCKRNKAVGGRPFARKDKLRDHVRKTHAA